MAATGEPTAPTMIDESRRESRHLWPYFLPDGRRFLYVRRSTEPTHDGLYLGSLDAPEGRRVAAVTSNVVYASGRLLFARDGVLYAQPFDVENARFTGDIA